jgi:hypothetical protein
VIPKPYQRHTTYHEWCIEQIRFLTTHANVYYTLEELAHYSQVKPTHNFRRLVNVLVKEQHLAKFILQRERGGFVGVYAKFGSSPPSPIEYWTPTPAPKYKEIE